MTKPANVPQAIVGQLFGLAAERAGGASALGRHLGLGEAEVRRYLAGESVPPVEVTLRMLDLVVEDQALKSLPEQAWRALLLPAEPES